MNLHERVFKAQLGSHHIILSVVRNRIVQVVLILLLFTFLAANIFILLQQFIVAQLVSIFTLLLQLSELLRVDRLERRRFDALGLHELACVESDDVDIAVLPRLAD